MKKMMFFLICLWVSLFGSALLAFGSEMSPNGALPAQSGFPNVYDVYCDYPYVCHDQSVFIILLTK